MYTETDQQEQQVVRWDTSKKYSKEELEAQREEFEKIADSGQVLCLTDLMINHGM